MPKLVAIYGSPRRSGNTTALLKKAVAGARNCGAVVEEFVLRDLKMSPCLEIYGCKKNGNCIIKDDFQRVRERVLASDGMMITSPIFFYTVSSHVKILMDRFQSLWVQKYWIEKVPVGQRQAKRKGLFISVGATHGKKLFDGSLLSMKYFFDVLDMELWRALLFRGLDFEGDVNKCPEHLDAAYSAGEDLVEAINNMQFA